MFRDALYQQLPTVREVLDLAIVLADQAIDRAQAADSLAQQYKMEEVHSLAPAVEVLNTVKDLLNRALRNRHRRLAAVPENAWALYAEQYDTFALQVDQLEALLDFLVKQTQGTKAVPLVWEAKNLVRDIDRELGW